MPATPQVLSGYLDGYGNPAIKISVYGVVEAARPDFEAIINTGFSGFLMMPMASVFPLTLTLMGTADNELADGSLISQFLAHGSVIIGEETVTGAITLGQAGDCGLLPGMGFLKKAHRSLWVNSTDVLLVHRDVEGPINQVLDSLQ